MTRKTLTSLAGLGSMALLVGAFVFQALGYLPCQMCLWQRWPHAVAIVLAVLALRFRSALVPLMGALSLLTTAAIGGFHTGVERGWWPGPASCTGGGGDALSGDLLSLDGPRLIMCDQVSWEFLTLSMPSWNMVFSLILAGLWIAALRRTD